MRKPLIVGIDPGTTAAYCVLDTESRIVAMGSGKHLNPSSIIFNLNQLGRVIAIGTDKRKIPFSVEKISIKLGARLISPDEDILVKDKLRLSGNIELRNNHELDALASAMYAFKKIEPLLIKIRTHLKEEGKEGLFEKIVPLVVIRGLNIKTAISLIEYKEEAIKTKPYTFSQKPETKPQLFEEIINSLRKENYWLKKQNLRFLKIITKKRREKKLLLKKINGFDKNVKTQRILELQEKRIRRLERMLKENESYQKKHVGELRNMESILLKINSEFIIVKKFASLEGFYQKERELELKKNDVIFIESFKGADKGKIEALQKKVNIILHGDVLPEILKRENFIFINNPSLEHETRDFATIRKGYLEERIKNHDLIRKVVQEYREERVENAG